MRQSVSRLRAARPDWNLRRRGSRTTSCPTLPMTAMGRGRVKTYCRGLTPQNILLSEPHNTRLSAPDFFMESPNQDEILQRLGRVDFRTASADS